VALKDWVEMKDTMMKLADEMPADKYSFKTTPQQRDFGEQVVHVTAGTVLRTISPRPASRLGLRTDHGRRFDFDRE